MQAGRLRDRVVVREPSTSRDPSGQPVEALHDGAETKKKGISGRSGSRWCLETAVATIRVWNTLFRSDITVASRLTVATGAFKGAIFIIIIRQSLTLACSARNSLQTGYPKMIETSLDFPG